LLDNWDFGDWKTCLATAEQITAASKNRTCRYRTLKEYNERHPCESTRPYLNTTAAWVQWHWKSKSLMIDFRPQPPDDDDHRSGRKPPPNYFSRKVQVRLLLMVFLFMFVIMLIEQASDPQLYRWIWTFSETAETDQDDSDRPVPADTKPIVTLPPPPNADQSLPDPLNWLPSKQSVDRNYQYTQRDFWEKLTEEKLTETLNAQERQLLNLVLKASRDQAPLSPESITSWPSLIEKLAARWKSYHEKERLKAPKFNTDLSDAQKKAWLDVLDALQRSNDLWDGPLRAGFEAIAKKQDLSQQQQQALAQVQLTLDQLELEKIRDRTLFRGSEHIIWFRLFEKLMRASPDHINQASSAQVNFLQLDNQGEQYRGKLVTVSGQIRQGYRIQAPQNILGIKEYSVFTLKPNNGPEQPIIIYCLETPEGFPPLPDNSRIGTKTNLREPASFTGYFFKSKTSKTKDSIFSAPLILARSPDWRPTGKNRLSQQRLGTRRLTSRHFSLILTGTLLIAILFTVFVYRRSRWKKSTVVSKSMDQQAQDSLSQLPEDEIGTGTLAALQALATEGSTDEAHDDHSSAGDARDS